MDDKIKLKNEINKNSIYFFSEIKTGLDEIYEGKHSLLNNLKNDEEKIDNIKENIYLLAYGDDYEEKLFKDQLDFFNETNKR